MTYYSIILFAKVSPIIQNIFTYYSNNFTDYSSNLHLILTFNSIIVYVLSIRKYGVPFVSKLKKFEGLRFMLVFTTHDAGIYDSCWYLRRMMLVFMIHAGIYDA